MTITLDFESDIDYFDGLEDVVYKKRNAITGISIEALRREVPLKEVMASDGHYKLSDVRFHTKLSNIDSPQLGDVIEDQDGDSYTILERRKDTLSARWKLLTRNLSITESLNTSVNVILVTYIADPATFVDLPNYQYYKRNLRAKIHRPSFDENTEHGILETEGVFIVITEDATLTTNHLFEDQNGYIYKINSSDKLDQIDMLPQYTCEKILIDEQVI